MTLQDKIKQLKNTKDYENLVEILGPELGELIYEIVNEVSVSQPQTQLTDTMFMPIKKKP
jgi:hypothetical protein